MIGLKEGSWMSSVLIWELVWWVGVIKEERVDYAHTEDRSD